MKKINFRLIAIVIIGICCAYATRRPAWMDSDTFHHYSYAGRSFDGTRYFVGYDLTAIGWEAGNQYDCVSPTIICTFIANPINLHTDFNSAWFYTTNVPRSGIDSVGTWVTL